MRHFRRILGFIILILLTVLLFRSGTRQPAISQLGATLTMKYVPSINAGDLFTLHLFWSGAPLPTPPEVQVTVFQGIGVIYSTIRLDASGEGQWDIAPQKLVQAGTAAVFARLGSTSARGSLTVLPLEADHLNLYSTANTLIAYGNAQAMGIALMGDRWGNPVSSGITTAIAINYPDGTKDAFEIDRHYAGFGWFPLASRGVPGRTSLTLNVGDQTQTAEIQQVPGTPSRISMTHFPSCILENTTIRPDLLELRALVADANGYPVSDGTVVDFFWKDGKGRALTLNGQAELRIPAPKRSGVYTYVVRSGPIAQGTTLLRVATSPLPAECLNSGAQ